MSQNKGRKKRHQTLAITVMMLVLFLSDIVGEKGQVFLDFAAFIGIIVIGIISIYMFVTGNRSGALVFLTITIALAVTGWGFYIENEVISSYGLGSFFVICLLIILLDKLNLLD